MCVDDSQVLSHLISRYENCVLYESSWPNELRLAKAFSAFEHSHGGLMLLGVSPRGRIIGVPQAELERSCLRLRYLVGKIYPFVSEIGLVQMKDKTVIYLVFNAVPDHLAPIEEISERVQERKEIFLAA